MPNLPEDKPLEQDKSFEPIYGGLPAPTGPDRARDGLTDPYLDNDHGNVQRLIESYGDNLRYCHATDSWMIWDGHRWDRDYSEQVRKLAETAMQSFWRSVSTDSERRSFASMSMNHSRIGAMLASAQAHLSISTEELDADPNMLNFLNGTVDLRTGKLYQHFQRQYITKLVHYDYKPSAVCPTFTSFLKQVLPTPSLVSYLQRALGYSITGHTREKVVFFPWGEGDNGKSTLLTTIYKLVHEYACLLQIDTLMSKQETANSSADLADLRGRRYVMTSETDKGQRLSEGKIKRITQGMGGRIKATKKYENPIEFDETHKIWIDANNLPVVRGSDNAIWNRLHPIPFSVVISKAKQNRSLQSTFLFEGEGILAWLVEGARLWHEQQLGQPARITKALTTWRSKMDQLSVFLEQRCKPCKTGVLTGSELYQAYEHWVPQEHETPYTLKDFLTALSQCPNVEKKHLEEGNVYRLEFKRFGMCGFATSQQSDLEDDGAEEE